VREDLPARDFEGDGMTKSREGGENEITLEAKKEATRTGTTICVVLAAWLQAARQAGDAERVRKIVKAQKYSGCRNIRKRRPRR
jgi:hypothetical protein